MGLTGAWDGPCFFWLLSLTVVNCRYPHCGDGSAVVAGKTAHPRRQCKVHWSTCMIPTSWIDYKVSDDVGLAFIRVQKVRKQHEEVYESGCNFIHDFCKSLI